MTDEKRVPAEAGNGNVPYPPVEGISNDSRLKLLSFNNRHTSTVFRIVSRHSKGLKLSDIQIKAGYPRGNPDHMRHRREIARACEMFVFFKYFMKKGSLYIPTGKMLTVDTEPRVFGADGLPRVRLASTATMPEYPRGA